MKGRFPDILHNPATGETATKLFEDANRMLDRIIEEKWLRANGVIGLFPANSVGDDIEVYTDESRQSVATTLHTLRQQGQHRDGVPNRAMSDFVAPRESGLSDHIGAFAVTAGLGAQDKITEFKAAMDDYSAILLEALADRLAEAFAERMHERVRHEFWGYAPDEHLRNDDLIAEKYVGIRPAPGYPACPDHTEKQLLWDLLKVRGERRGSSSPSRWPCGPGRPSPAGTSPTRSPSTSWWGASGATRSRSTPSARAGRCAEAERWLAPNLGYNPED